MTTFTYCKVTTRWFDPYCSCEAVTRTYCTMETGFLAVWGYFTRETFTVGVYRRVVEFM